VLNEAYVPAICFFNTFIWSKNLKFNHMNLKYISLIFIVLLSTSAIGQHTNILIDDEGFTFAPEEPSIMVNPNNTDHMVAGSNVDNMYYSTDGGQTWTAEKLSSSYGVWGDPCIIVDTANRFYFLHLSNPPSGGYWIDRIVCQTKEEIGGDWNNGSFMGYIPPKQQDKEWAIVDRSNNNIYVTWTQFDDYGSSSPDDFSNILFSKSTDNGESWSDVLQINEISGDCIDSDNTTEGAVPAVGPNGEVFVAWAGPAGLVFDRSSDQGSTWLDQDIFISDIPGGWDFDVPGIQRCNGLPITICDLSGGVNHGTIYVNWSDQRNGSDDTDVWLVKSTDGGNSWSSPIRVNDDGPGKHQFFTWMDIDQTNGNLYFVYYDRRNYDNNNTDVYMAVSKDGGATFTNFKISESPFLPSNNIFFGDYTNLSVHDNVIRPIWTRLQGGDLSVWTALVDPDLVGTAENEIPVLSSLEQNYPNPFKESTYLSFKLRNPGEVSLVIYDLYGRELVTLIDKEHRIAGKYIENFNPAQYSLIPGVYYLVLTNEGEQLKRRMVLVE